MEHRLMREHAGQGMMGSITPTCSCGWRGRAEFAHNDYQYTNVREQETEHFASIRNLYRIYSRKQVEVNTDPQRRCYNGCHFSSEWVWTKWVYMGAVFSEEEAISSVQSWQNLNPKRHEYKYEKANP